LDLHAADYSSLNYGAMVYGKTALVLDYLEAWMGKAQFDKSMKTYFENWKFKHPSPGDFFADFSSISGVDLSAFRNNLFTSTRRVDYSLRRVNRGDSGYRVKVRNL